MWEYSSMKTFNLFPPSQAGSGLDLLCSQVWSWTDSPVSTSGVPGLWVCWELNPNFVNARPVLYQLSCISIPIRTVMDYERNRDVAKLVRMFGKHSQCPRESQQMQGHPRLHDEVLANGTYMAQCLKTAQ